jgi:chaperonin GroES
MKPIRNNILFRPFEGDDISEGGIFIPDTARKLSNKGEIVEIGEGTKERPMKFKKGDKAIRVKDWGTEVEKNGIKYFLMEDKAILALVE